MAYKKKVMQVGIRLDEKQHEMLTAVQDHIAACSRGQAPDISDIIRCLIGWGNQALVTKEERDYLSGKTSALSEVHNIPVVNPMGFGEIPVPASKKSKKLG